MQEKDSENFCGFGSGLKRLPFRWPQGVMTAVPAFGGTNGTAVSINDFGQVTGAAGETTTDPACAAPQTHDFEAALWGPGKGAIRELRPFPGDTVGSGFGSHAFLATPCP